MDREEREAGEANQRYRYAAQENYDRTSIITEQAEMNLFVMLKPKILIDGNQYCVLYGDDLQCGVAGFGDTIRTAIYNFNKQFDKELPNPSDKAKI